jgi:hypothetical protein
MHPLSVPSNVWLSLLASFLTPPPFPLALHQVRRDDFLAVIKTIRKSITPEMIQFFEEWRDQSGGRSA